MDRDDLGGRVRLARFEGDLAGMEQLAQLDDPPTVGQSLGDHLVVAAPGQMDAPDLALPLAEPGRAGEQQRWVLVRRAAAPVLGEHGAVRPRPPIRLELASVPPVERQQFAGVLGQRERDAQPVEHVPVVALVRDHHLHDQRVAELERRGEPQAGDRVDRLDDEPAVGQLVSGRTESAPTTPGHATGDRATLPGRGSPNRARAPPRRGDDVGRALHERTVERARERRQT